MSTKQPRVFSPTQLPSGRWQGRVRLGSRNATKAFDYQHEAAAWAAAEADRWLAAMHADPHPAVTAVSPDAPTVASYAKVYLAASPHLAAASVEWYEAQMAGMGAMGKRRMGEITRRDVTDWRARMLAGGASNNQVNTRTKALGIWHKYAMNTDELRGLVTYDPTAGIKRLPTPKKAETVLERDDEAALFEVLAERGDAETVALVMLLIDCGLRIGEALALPSDSLLRRNGRYFLDVYQVVDKVTGEVRQDTKDHEKRKVPVASARLVAALVPLVEAAKARAADGGSTLVFPNRDGGARDYTNFRNRTWAPLCKDAGFTLTIHRLRHTYATRLSEAGVLTPEIQKLLGHSDQEVTEGYIHAGSLDTMFDKVAASQAAA